MDVFISWSGARSKALAQALSELLPDAIQNLKPWMSDRDISAGSRWAEELNKKLANTNFGVLCLTAQNVGAPWLLFEAGSLSKSVSSSSVVPYCLGVRSGDVPFPLAQFQGVDADEAGTKKLIKSLNSAAPAPMDETRLDRVFQRWWPDLRSRIEAIAASEEIVATIDKPRILCGASKQYAEDSRYEFYRDVEVVQKAFPGRVTIERCLTSKRLRELLRSKPRFDIVHLVVPVDAISGELIFSPVDAAHLPTTTEIDRMPAGAFAALVRDAQTSLVFLATCHAYAMAVDVSPVTNIIATNITLSGESAEEWEECFYDLLANGDSLFKAYELTKLQYTTPLRLIERRNVIFNKQP